MPARFQVGEKVTCVRDNNVMGKKSSGTIIDVEKGVRNVGSNWHNDGSVCVWCIIDTLTCGLCQPESLWRYTVKYDSDGQEEHRVTSERIFKEATAAGAATSATSV